MGMFLTAEDGGRGRLTPDEFKLVTDDLEAGRACLHCNLLAKLGFWSRLPWHLAGLASLQEGDARACGLRAVQMFDLDPRRQAHHRLSWKHLSPGPFREELDKFLSGQPRSSCSETFQQTLAGWRFIPVSETTIEGKHARVSLQSMGQLSPARVSLSNRLQLVEDRLRRGLDVLPRIAHLFGQARHPRRLPDVLGFPDHPRLLSVVARHPSYWIKPLCEIIYRCSLDFSLCASYKA